MSGTVRYVVVVRESYSCGFLLLNLGWVVYKDMRGDGEGKEKEGVWEAEGLKLLCIWIAL